MLVGAVPFQGRKKVQYPLQTFASNSLVTSKSVSSTKISTKLGLKLSECNWYFTLKTQFKKMFAPKQCKMLKINFCIVNNFYFIWYHKWKNVIKKTYKLCEMAFYGIYYTLNDLMAIGSWVYFKHLICHSQLILSFLTFWNEKWR